MHNELQFKVNKIQLALFPKNFNLDDKLKIASDIRSRTGILFDGEPVILPLPIDAPIEIPRIILQSKDHGFACNIAIPRIDFFQNFIEGTENTYQNVSENYILKAGQIYNYFVNGVKLVIGRVGFVINFVADLEESSNKFLQTIFNSNAHIAKSEKIENISVIFTEKNVLLTDWETNRRIIIESMRKISDPSNDKRINLQYDFNTDGHKITEYNFSAENIEKILRVISAELTIAKLNEFVIVK